MENFGGKRDWTNSVSRHKRAEKSLFFFEREYIRHMVTDYEKAVQLFSTAAKEGHDAAIKAFASQTLPTLQKHLQMARQLTQRVGSMSQAR